MARLILKSITCINTAETFSDELYVTFNGTKRSLPSMTQGQTKALGQEFIFTGSPILNLFEDDGNHWYDRDDFIAGHAITSSPGDLTLDFKSTSGQAIDAHYIITASVDPAATTAILRLNSITCVETAETFGDELYVTFNGTKRSLPNMDDGQTKTLGQEFIFTGSPLLSLFENDGDHWYDRDDFIAGHTITRSPGDKTLVFKANSGNGVPAHYEMNMTVRPGP
jgi:hypothetical protein